MSGVFRGSLLATYGLGVQGLARLAYTVLIGRELGAQSLGALSAVLALSVFLSLLWPMGCSVALSAELAVADPQDRSNVWRAYRLDIALSSTGAAVVAALLSVPFADGWDAAIGAGLLTWSYCLYVVVRGARLGLGGFLRIAVADSVFFVMVAFVAAILVATNQLSLVTALAPLAVSYLVSLAILWPIFPAGVARGSVSRRFVAHNSGGQVATGGLLNIAMLGAQVAGGPRAVGLFAAAFSLATPASMIGQSLNQVLVPTFAASRREDGRRGTRILPVAALGLITIIGLLALAAPMLLSILYGAEFEEAAPLMRGMLLGVLVFSLSLLPAAWLIANERSRDYVRAAAAGLLIGSVAIFLLGIPWGVWGAVVGYMCGSGLTAALMLSAYRRGLSVSQ